MGNAVGEAGNQGSQGARNLKDKAVDAANKMGNCLKDPVKCAKDLIPDDECLAFLAGQGGDVRVPTVNIPQDFYDSFVNITGSVSCSLDTNAPASFIATRADAMCCMPLVAVENNLVGCKDYCTEL